MTRQDIIAKLELPREIFVGSDESWMQTHGENWREYRAAYIRDAKDRWFGICKRYGVINPLIVQQEPTDA